MNTKSFETTEKTVLSEYLKSKEIPEALQQKWYHTIIDNKELFEGADFDGIYQLVSSLTIEGIDDDIVGATVATIAFDNNIKPIMDGCCSCFMLFAKKYHMDK